MGILGPTTPISSKHRRITLQNAAGSPVPDGEGGYTQAWTDLATVDARVAPASQSSLERITAGTAITAATHEVRIAYRAGISTSTRILLDGRQLNIVSIQDPEERHVELILVCTEVVP
jgi:SPP1 family predicted phage head-tail adaptor